MNRLLTPAEIADLLNVKQSTVYKWVHIGFIPHLKLGGALRFDEGQIRKWLERRSVSGRSLRRPDSAI